MTSINAMRGEKQHAYGRKEGKSNGTPQQLELGSRAT
jgi:hypothetical protein